MENVTEEPDLHVLPVLKALDQWDVWIGMCSRLTW
jgi:hypothetical protein